jgi:ATP-dependent Clp protease adapter protein ClpS
MSASFPFSRSGPVVSPGFIPKYHLILLRSPDVPLHVVVKAVRKVTRFAEAEALARMWDAHHHGWAVVVTTYLERAEFLAELLAEGGLRVSLEEAGW